MTHLLILYINILFTITILNIVYNASRYTRLPIYDNDTKSRFTDNKKRLSVTILNDMLPLSVTARRGHEYFSEKVDCNSRIIECDSDMDCQRICIPENEDDMREAQCLPNTGFCQYQYDKCLNNGIPTNYFSKGRIIWGCICTEEFIGQYCQIPNQMKPIDSGDVLNLLLPSYV